MKIKEGEPIPWCPLLKDYCLIGDCMWFDKLYLDGTCIIVRIAEYLENLKEIEKL